MKKVLLFLGAGTIFLSSCGLPLQDRLLLQQAIETSKKTQKKIEQFEGIAARTEKAAMKAEAAARTAAIAAERAEKAANKAEDASIKAFWASQRSEKIFQKSLNK